MVLHLKTSEKELPKWSPSARTLHPLSQTALPFSQVMSFCSHSLNTYMMYMGATGVYAHTFP
jgi:hypothetical protein